MARLVFVFFIFFILPLTGRAVPVQIHGTWAFSGVGCRSYPSMDSKTHITKTNPHNEFGLGVPAILIFNPANEDGYGSAEITMIEKNGFPETEKGEWEVSDQGKIIWFTNTNGTFEMYFFEDRLIFMETAEEDRYCGSSKVFVYVFGKTD